MLFEFFIRTVVHLLTDLNCQRSTPSKSLNGTFHCSNPPTHKKSHTRNKKLNDRKNVCLIGRVRMCCRTTPLRFIHYVVVPIHPIGFVIIHALSAILSLWNSFWREGSYYYRNTANLFLVSYYCRILYEEYGSKGKRLWKSRYRIIYGLEEPDNIAAI